jgi:catechol 2,3-dioxygenase-like lactoylglutathione lyase family enzyme
MAVEFNHTIVHVRDKHEAATFLTEVLGVPGYTSYGPFAVVELANGASLDFADNLGDVVPSHYAFLVSETDFDEIFARLKERGITYAADPFGDAVGEINTNDGGRGVYWDDPNGHRYEIITRPYGSGG